MTGDFALAATVTKADGSKQLFDKAKVVQTCLRMGADRYTAYEVAEKVERRIYDGMPTRVVLQLIFAYLRRYRPAVRHVFDLRRGISIMEPKPEFEAFIRILLAHNGFEVTPNQILRGRCSEHEVDAVAKKDGALYFVEVKHHYSYHALTGLDESRIAWAVLEDVGDAFASGLADVRIDRAMIVTNTRYSDHAVQYGACKEIMQIGWSSPQYIGIQDMVEAGKLYPLSCLRGLRVEDRLRLVNAGFVLIKQLLDTEASTIAAKTGLPQETVFSIIEKSQHSLNTLWQ